MGDCDRRELPRRRAHVGEQDDGDEKDEEVKKPSAGARSPQEEKTTAVAGVGMARHWRHPEGEDDMSARGSRCLPCRGGRRRYASEEEGIGVSGIEGTGEEGEWVRWLLLGYRFLFLSKVPGIAGKETRFRGFFLTFLLLFSFSFFN